MGRRCLPAEWHPQAGLMLAWPDERTDWVPRLAQAQLEYAALIAAVSHHQPVLVMTRGAAAFDACRCLAGEAGADARRLLAVRADYDDTWVRDYGPLTILEHERPRLLDFRFDGWGGKFDARRDDAVTASIHALGGFGDAKLESVDFVLEGGAIESDGAGTILTTARCWRARHPDLERGQIESLMARHLGARRVLWLQHGGLEGDDTDAHVDTLARFCDARTIAYQHCDDVGDPHHDDLGAMHDELRALRTDAGGPYRLVALPWPGDVRHEGRRLPAGYANFVLANGALLVPAFGVSADGEAVARLQRAFPERRVKSLPSGTLIWQNGGLHCATMQLPQGVALKAVP